MITHWLKSSAGWDQLVVTSWRKDLWSISWNSLRSSQSHLLKMTQGSQLNPVRICVSQWQNCSCGGESALCFDTHNKTSFLDFTLDWKTFTPRWRHKWAFFSQAFLFFSIFSHSCFERHYYTWHPPRIFTSKSWYCRWCSFYRFWVISIQKQTLVLIEKRLTWQFNVDINQSFVYYSVLSVCPHWTGTTQKRLGQISY